MLTRLHNTSQSHQKKVLVTVWRSSAGLIHYSFLKPSETMTAEKYCRGIVEMHQKLTRNQPALIIRKGPILLHDNARLHISMITRQKLHTLNYEALNHPPYSPDLSSTDFHLFKNLDNFLKEKYLRNLKDAETALNEFVTSRVTSFYNTCIKMFFSRCQKCIETNGFYFY